MFWNRLKPPRTALAFVLILIICTTGELPRACAETIVVFGNSYKPPKIFLHNGYPDGILPEVLKWAEPQLGCKFDIRLCPWARAYNSSLRELGGIVGLSKTTERERIFDFSVPIYYDEVVMLVRRGEDFAYSSMEDLRGKRVGIGNKGSYGDEFERGRTQGIFIVDEDNGPVMRIRKLLNHRIDVALLSPGRHALAESLEMDGGLRAREEELAILPQPFKRDPNYLGFGKALRMRPFLERFDRVVREGWESGEIREIIDRFASPEIDASVR